MRLAVISVVLAVIASGCLNKPTEDDLDPTNTTNTTGAMGDGRGPIIAFEETNMTEAGVGGVDHHHDMWEGRTRVTMFEVDAMMDPSVPQAQFRPPAYPEDGKPALVYEGTATVEFTISNPRRHVCEPLITFGGHFYCTDYLGEGTPAAPSIPDPAPPTGLELRYKHASTSEWIDVGEIAWDQPAVIKVLQAIETDMPHATSSGWEFLVTSPNELDTTLQFTAKAEIVRGEGEVPLWPGHPLFYTPDKPSRVVVESVAAESCDSGLTLTGCATATDPQPVVPSKLISYGTRTLFIWANVTQLDTPSPVTAPSAWFLYHRNSTGQNNITNPFDFENYGIDKRELFWALPVDDGAMDSPYSDGSRWQFELGASYTSPENPADFQRSCYGGCADWAAKYTLTIIASSEILPPDQYHMYCLDPFVYCGEQDA